MNDIRRRVEEVIAKQTGVIADYDAALRGFDSLDRAQLLCDLEEEFGDQLPTYFADHIENFESVESIAGFMEAIGLNR